MDRYFDIKCNETITLTFGEYAENHIGMEKIGNKCSKGYSLDDLLRYKKIMEENGKECSLYDLRNIYDNNIKLEEAYILVIKKYLSNELSNNLLKKLKKLDWDKKYYDYKKNKILNKKARYNLCFDVCSQEPDYINGKGRIISYNSVLELNDIKNELCNKIDRDELVCEGNYYYDLNSCGISWHGDKERLKVIGLRLGKKMPLKFNWFKNNKNVGNPFEINLENGDMYIMSEKATGYDSNKRDIYVLKHSAGCKKYTNL